MRRREIRIEPEIERARTLPAAFYTDPEAHAGLLERGFARGWHLLPERGGPERPGASVPWTLLPGSLDEPLLLTRDEAGSLHCLSNVCTHRGNLVVPSACAGNGLRCGYHGRRFGLDGRFRSMPEFEGLSDFPGPEDDLPRLPVERWGPLAFTSLDPAIPFERWIEPVRRRLGWWDVASLALDPEASRVYDVQAHWALYCDNYLEGFHIPYVHAGLAAVLDYGAYRTERFGHGSLQLGIGDDATAGFRPPAGHPDRESRVSAYYFWLFPNLMLNAYPWGLSVNVVEPLGLERTRVRFLGYVLEPGGARDGAGGDLHRVELEDEAVVEQVQRGVRSRLYRRGRFSPARETGVHHFHRLVADCLASSETDA